MSSPARTHYPLGWHLIALVGAAMLPFFAFSTYLADRLMRDERAASERDLERRAAELAAAVDHEFEASIRTLAALASSPSLQTGDLAAFHAALGPLLATQPSWVTILLHEDPTHPRLSAKRPFGTDLEPSQEPESLKAVFAEGRPVIGPLTRVNLTVGPLANKHTIAVRVPVFADARVTGVLTAILTAETLQRTAEQFYSSADEWTRTVIDPNGLIAARSRGTEGFIGTAIKPESHAQLRAADSGLVRATTRDDEAIVSAFHRARLSQWTASVSVRADTLEAPTRRTKAFVYSVGAALLVAFGGMTLIYARSLSSDIKSASDTELKPSRVSEVEKLRESLQRSLRQAHDAQAMAESASRAKSEFLANMSHELRTPLNVVLGFAEVNAGPDVTDAERLENLALIERNGQHLLHLIDDVLDLSKIEAGKLRVEARNVDLTALLHELVTAQRPTAAQKGVTLDLTLASDVPRRIKTDPTRLRQIVMNVLGNAVKFTSAGSITTSVIKAGDDVEIRVRDSGIGMSPEQQARLFEPFAQADTSTTRRFGGTGLGLALSKRLVQLLGGDLRLVASAPAQGATFAITIPAASGGVSETTSPAPEGADLAFGGRRVLVADDAPDNAKLVAAFLRATGAEVDIAHDGAQAVAMALAHPYDVVLMDVQMPGIDGFEAARRLRDAGFRAPIVALTAHALAEHRERAVASGCSGFLTKPVTKTKLVDAITGFLSETT